MFCPPFLRNIYQSIHPSNPPGRGGVSRPHEIVDLCTSNAVDFSHGEGIVLCVNPDGRGNICISDIKLRVSADSPPALEVEISPFVPRGAMPVTEGMIGFAAAHVRLFLPDTSYQLKLTTPTLE